MDYFFAMVEDAGIVGIFLLVFLAISLWMGYIAIRKNRYTIMARTRACEIGAIYSFLGIIPILLFCIKYHFLSVQIVIILSIFLLMTLIFIISIKAFRRKMTGR